MRVHVFFMFSLILKFLECAILQDKGSILQNGGSISKLGPLSYFLYIT